MAIILQFSQPSLNEMMNEFHRLYDVAQTAEKKANNTRIKAGLLLREMRERVESGECGEITWWQWFEANSVRSRKNAEELLRIAESDDPEEAHEEEKKRQREKNSLVRTREKQFPVERIAKLIGKLTDEQRQELGAAVKLTSSAPPVIVSPAATVPVVNPTPAAVPDMPVQSAEDRKALYAIENAEPATMCRPTPLNPNAARAKQKDGPLVTVPACANVFLRADQAVTEAAETISEILPRLSSEDIDYLVEKALTLANSARAFAELVRKSRADKRSHIAVVEPARSTLDMEKGAQAARPAEPIQVESAPVPVEPELSPYPGPRRRQRAERLGYQIYSTRRDSWKVTPLDGTEGAGFRSRKAEAVDQWLDEQERKRGLPCGA